MAAAPLLTGRQAYSEREEPEMMTSRRGCGLLTGQMVERLVSTNCVSSRPVEASMISTGCRAAPPKSSEIYLRSPHYSLRTAHEQPGPILLALLA